MTFFWSCNGFQGLVYVVSLVLPMLIQNGLFVSAHPAPHSAFPNAYIRYTDIKGSYPKQRQLECKPSACQSNKQYLEHFVKKTAKLECQSSSETYSIIIKVPFCKSRRERFRTS